MALGGPYATPNLAVFKAAWQNAPYSAKVELAHYAANANKAQTWADPAEIDNDMAGFVQAAYGGSDGKITTANGRSFNLAYIRFVTAYEKDVTKRDVPDGPSPKVNTDPVTEDPNNTGTVTYTSQRPTKYPGLWGVAPQTAVGTAAATTPTAQIGSNMLLYGGIAAAAVVAFLIFRR